jgi:caffeoyl-CoA O-methyltransferase
MSNQSIGLSDHVHDYLLNVSLRETQVQRRLRAETMQHPKHNMQIAPEQGQFMQLLVRLIDAKRALEIGVFTGYSALSVAYALPDDGSLVACDISRDYTEIAEHYWNEAGVADRIDLRIAPALETLQALREDGAEGAFDFVFIDADKISYPDYYAHSLALVRSGGLIVLDNMLRDGRMADPDIDDASVQAIHDLNEQLHTDERIDLSLLPVADGLTLARKR